MTLPRKMGNYGSPKKNGRLLSNPKTDITQSDWNRLVADVAALTGPPTKLRAQFLTQTGNGSITPSWFAAQWGQGSADAPAIARTGTGTYTVQTPSAWITPGTWVYSLDPDQIVQTSEQVIWVDSSAGIDGNVADFAASAGAYCRTKRAGFTITVYVYNSSNALSDLGGAVPIRVVGA